MSRTQSPPEPHSLATYVEDGARILAILLIWTLLGAVVALVVTQLGGVGSFLRTYGPGLGAVFALAGLLNAITYVVYRGIDYYRAG